MYDPNSLMYVTKEYENTLRDKAKKIYADDVVKTTLDSVNKELDNILLQINNRLDEISNKSTSPFFINGITSLKGNPIFPPKTTEIFIFFNNS